MLTRYVQDKSTDRYASKGSQNSSQSTEVQLNVVTPITVSKHATEDTKRSGAGCKESRAQRREKRGGKELEESERQAIEGKAVKDRKQEYSMRVILGSEPSFMSTTDLSQRLLVARPRGTRKSLRLRVGARCNHTLKSKFDRPQIRALGHELTGSFYTPSLSRRNHIEVLRHIMPYLLTPLRCDLLVFFSLPLCSRLDADADSGVVRDEDREAFSLLCPFLAPAIGIDVLAKHSVRKKD